MSVSSWGKTHVHSVCVSSTWHKSAMGVCLSVCWLRMVVGMCAGHWCVQVEGGGVLVMYVVVSGCVGRCGSPWGAALAGYGVTACEVLVESPGCSWGALHHSWASPSHHPDSSVPLGQLKPS